MRLRAAGPAAFGLSLLSLVAPSVAEAQFRGPAGWGLRAGASDDPDQVVAGIHLSLGEVVPRLRFQPSLELGSGDDTTVLVLTLPVHYRVPVAAQIRPYFGGGLALANIERDLPRGGSEDEFDIGVALIGGVDWPMAGGHDLFAELSLGGGESYDAKIVVGVTF